MRVHYAVGDHRDPCHRHLLSPQHLRELVPDIATRDVFLCGPPAMAGATVRALRRAGVAREQIPPKRSPTKGGVPMPRAIRALIVTVAALVLVVNFHPSAVNGVATRKSAGTPQTPAPAATTSTTTPPKSQPEKPSSQTVTGSTVDTMYGPVQVTVQMTNGEVASVTAAQLPYDNPRSQEISSQAEPILQSEALQAQSAQIDVVSGATYTSEGYASSLQSAIDKVKQAA